MSDGTVTGFFYDPVDLKLNQIATITAAISGGLNVPVQITGYQYDGGGNIHAYQNVAEASQEYRSHFNLGYDGANRLIGFDAFAQKRSETMTASGTYGFDLGHRITSRELSIEGDPGSRFTRRWNYLYENAPAPRNPVHAPNSIAFTVPSLEATRISSLEYDDVGRLAKVRAVENGAAPGVLSNRRLDWDGAGRLKRVLGGPDKYWANNEDYLDEEYIYDFMRQPGPENTPSDPGGGWRKSGTRDHIDLHDAFLLAACRRSRYRSTHQRRSSGCKFDTTRQRDGGADGDLPLSRPRCWHHHR